VKKTPMFSLAIRIGKTSARQRFCRPALLNDCRSGYDGLAMLATRIKRRPYSFALWAMTSLLWIGIVWSCFRGVRYYGQSNIIHFWDGQLAFRLNPIGNPIPQRLHGMTSWDVSAAPLLMKVLRFFTLPYSEIAWSFIPLGYPMVILTTLTTWRFWRPFRIAKQGHCQSCGYNLQGNESGKCPECGKAIA
jgi:hypothetical protein